MNNLKIALENVMQNDVAPFERGAEHKFTKKFEREISRISRKAARVGAAAPKAGARRIASLAVAAAAVFSLGMAVGALTTGFKITSYNREFDGKPAKRFTVAYIENAPETVETLYTIGELPEELKLRRTVFNDERTRAFTTYIPDRDALKNGDEYVYDFIYLRQFTREAFGEGYPASDYVAYKELTLGGCPAWFITYERFYGDDAVLIWDAGDYIFELSGNLTEERALGLAGSVEIYDGEITTNEFEEV